MRLRRLPDRQEECRVCDAFVSTRLSFATADKPADLDVVKNVVFAGPFRISCEAEDAGAEEAVAIDVTRQYVERECEGRDRGIARVRRLPGRRKTDIDW